MRTLTHIALSAPARLLVLAALITSPVACGGDEAPSAEGPRAVAITGAAVIPAPLVLEAERPEIVYRYLDAAGAVQTASAIADIPEGSRGTVVLFDTASPPPAGWDQVADLRKGLPVTATPKRDFTFQVAQAAGASAAGVAAAGSPARAASVILFSTQGCGYCKKAREFFRAHRVPFTEHDIENEAGAGATLAALAKKAQVPQSQLSGVPIIFVDGQAVLGWDEARVRRLLRI